MFVGLQSASPAKLPLSLSASSGANSSQSLQFVSRYGVALAILGIDSAIVPKTSGVDGGGGSPMPGNLVKIARDFESQLAIAKKQPGISDANARHNAQYETIMANRADFPPSEFYIHTELGDGASVTTTIPAIGTAPADSWAPSREIVTAARLAAGVPMASVVAAYAEWN